MNSHAKAALSLVIISLIVIVLTYFFFVQFSVLGFALLGLAAMEGMIWLQDRFGWKRINIEEQLHTGNMAVADVVKFRYLAYAIVIAAALLAVPKAAGAEPPHIQIAAQYIGYTETGNNRGKMVDIWNRSVKNPLGSPYCAAFVSWVLDQAKATSPKTRTGWSRGFVTKDAIPILKAAPDQMTYAILLFVRRGGGHIGFIRKGGSTLTTIEANTSNGQSGSEWNGGGVFQRKRNLKQIASPYNVFRATHIVPVRYS